MLILFPEVPFTVNAPLTLNISPAVNIRFLPPVVDVKLLNVIAGFPEPARVELLVVLNVTVPPFAVKVPLFVIFFAIVKPAEGGAVNAPFAATVRDPLTAIVGLFVLAVTVTAFVPFPMVKSFPTFIV